MSSYNTMRATLVTIHVPDNIAASQQPLTTHLHCGQDGRWTTRFFEDPDAPAPAGLTPNFVDGPSRAGQVIATFSVCFVLATIFVGLRLYVRLGIIRIFGISDYLLLIGYVFAIVNAALAVNMTTIGFGRHGWDVPLANTSPILKSIWWQTKTYVVSLAFTKIAILCIYPHLSPSQSFRLCVWALAGLVACSSIVTLVWSICSCLPIHNAWSLAAIASGKCPINTNLIIYTGAVNVVTDIAILVLPMIMLRRVSLSRKKKIGVVLMLATGSLASFISIMRVNFSLRNVTVLDGTWTNVPIIYWSVAELFAGVICACLPTLRPLARYLPSMLGSFAESSQRGKSTNRDEIKPNTQGSFLDRVTMNKKSFRTRDDTSEDYILEDRIIVTTEYNVSAGGVHDGETQGTKTEGV